MVANIALMGLIRRLGELRRRGVRSGELEVVVRCWLAVVVSKEFAPIRINS